MKVSLFQKYIVLSFIFRVKYIYTNRFFFFFSEFAGNTVWIILSASWLSLELLLLLTGESVKAYLKSKKLSAICLWGLLSKQS